jgi:hypothetical protein
MKEQLNVSSSRSASEAVVVPLTVAWQVLMCILLPMTHLCRLVPADSASATACACWRTWRRSGVFKVRLAHAHRSLTDFHHSQPAVPPGPSASQRENSLTAT